MKKQQTLEPVYTDTLKKEKHNGIISFWKFMFCLLIIIFHCSIRSRDAGYTGEILFEYGRIGVEFFFIVSGYLMAKKALNKKETLENIGEETIQFIWKKVRKIFPYMLIAFIITIIVANYSKGKIISSIWNLLFLDMSGIKGETPLGHTWYISAMLISMLILYPLIRKYKKNFVYIISPIIVLGMYGFIAQTYGAVESTYKWTGIIFVGMLRAFAGLSLGCISYEIAEKMQNMELTKTSKIILTIIEILGFIAIFYISNKQNGSKYDFQMIFILFISITICFSTKTYFYNWVNNKFFYYLEKLSLPMYLNQGWVMSLVFKYGTEFNYYTKVEIAVIGTIVSSIIIMFLMEKLQKIFEKKKSKITKIFISKKN